MALAILAALLVLSCAPPDRPAALGPPVPREALALLHPDTVRSLTVASGVRYHYLWSPVGPWAVHLLEVDAGRCGVGFAVVRAPGAPGSSTARRAVPELLGYAPPGAVAAVNGDFFLPEGRPLGPELSSSGFRSRRERPVFSWMPGRGAWIGTAEVVGDSAVRVAGATGRPDRLPRGTAIVSGYPVLLDGGRRVGDLEVSERPSFAALRHARTLVGRAAGSQRLWLAVVDGRQGAYSEGMTLPEAAELLESLGSTDALNLDGGGSSVMVLGDRTVSRPAGDEGERAVVNALVVLSDPSGCPISAPDRG